MHALSIILELIAFCTENTFSSNIHFKACICSGGPEGTKIASKDVGALRQWSECSLSALNGVLSSVLSSVLSRVFSLVL